MKRTRYAVISAEGTETIRTDRATAESDVSIFWWLGKKTWIEEVA